MKVRQEVVCLVAAAVAASCCPAVPQPAVKPGLTGTVPAKPPKKSAALNKAIVQAGEGVSHPELAELLREHWAWVLRSQPLRATRLGVHDYDHALPDNSAVAIATRRTARRAFHARASALAVDALDDGDRITQELFLAGLGSAVASEVCDFHLWTISSRGNPVTEWNELHELHKVETEQDGDNLLKRYSAISNHIDNEVLNLQAGAKRGLYATAESTRRVVAMVKKQLSQPLEQWPMLKPGKAPHASWPAAKRDAYRAQLTAVVKEQVKPALERYGAVVELEILLKARDGAHSGLVALPIGKACYAARVKAFTTLPLEPQAVHDTGIAKIATTDAEMTELGKKALGAESLADSLAKLRTDKKLYFATEQEVVDAAQATLDLAKKKMGDFFGILPKADCIMRRIPAYEAPYTTIAYYRPPHTDGSKPGEYFINVHKPETRPRFEAVVLAIHEAIPGHHLQIAISQELSAVPAFRKHGGFTAYVEGWGLYTERLGLEMGLYATDLDRIGMVSFDAWRAGRLVVDTGIHAFGWSRDKARKYLEEHTALSRKNIDNEVDRYINWPGQALAYKIGQLAIWKLRREAEKDLGDEFSIKAFHDVVLGSGAVTLPVLQRRVRAWVAKTQAK